MQQKLQFPDYQNLSEFTLMPIYWLGMEMELSAQGREYLFSTLHDQRFYVTIICDIGLALGLILLFASIVFSIVGDRQLLPIIKQRNQIASKVDSGSTMALM